MHDGPSRQDYATPWSHVHALERERGLAFDLDVCAEPWSAKARHYIGLPRDGLAEPWSRWNFANPPYSDQAAWLRRAAYEATHNGNTTACLVRASIDARYWWRLVTTRATTDLYVGRIAFIDPSTRKPKGGSNFASALALYGPDFEPGVVRWRDAETGELIDVRRARSIREAA